MDHREIVKKAIDAGVQLVFFLYCDNGGVIRGKSIHVSGLKERLNNGIGHPKAMQAMTDTDRLLELEDLTPVGEIRLIPDPETFTILPYAPKRAVMMADMIRLDRQPWEVCARSFLKRMLDRAASRGLTINAAFEPEWTLATKEGDYYAPCDESMAYTSLGAIAPMKVIDDVVAALEGQGVSVEQYYPEYGHGQQELSIRYADALRAADNHVLYRETVRNVAWQHGFYASFAPKPFPDKPGNGCHLHFSAWDDKGERNLFFDGSDRFGLSQIGYQFIGGVLEHLPALVTMTCPSVNSYRRIGPKRWSSSVICYGPDNREAPVRIASTFWGEEMASTNLELKPSDSSANPYLSLGSLIAAGLDGVDRKLYPSDDLMLEVDPATLTEQELEKRGIQALPTSLGAAIENLENDQLLLDALGPVLARSYLAIRRADDELFSSKDMDYELKQHFFKY